MPKKCIHENCLKIPVFNLPSENTGIYCFEHKKENMIDVKSKRCIHENCLKRPNFNLPSENTGIYCFEHKKEHMINVKNINCQYEKCKERAIYGLKDERAQYCNEHKKENMINMILENKCIILDCENEFEYKIGDNKYCNNHIPTENIGMLVKKLCKYCDIREESKYICNDCKKIKNKKEWSIVRYLRKVIDTPFEYNSSKMLQGCSKKRPDIYFDLLKHCLIVEIDEYQHNTYHDSCECARINEIVNGIGGKSIILLRYNPDKIENKGKELKIKNSERLDLLLYVIKEELIKSYEEFTVKMIQIYYNDNYDKYKAIKEEIITDLVCI